MRLFIPCRGARTEFARLQNARSALGEQAMNMQEYYVPCDGSTEGFRCLSASRSDPRHVSVEFRVALVSRGGLRLRRSETALPRRERRRAGREDECSEDAALRPTRKCQARTRFRAEEGLTTDEGTARR